MYPSLSDGQVVSSRYDPHPFRSPLILPSHFVIKILGLDQYANNDRVVCFVPGHVRTVASFAEPGDLIKYTRAAYSNCISWTRTKNISSPVDTFCFFISSVPRFYADWPDPRPPACRCRGNYFLCGRYEISKEGRYEHSLLFATDALKSPTSTQFSIRSSTRVWLRLIAFVLVIYTLMIIL